MICSCCEKEIGSDEEFYSNGEEFYCQDCVKEETVTYYILLGEDTYLQDNEIDKYDNIEEAIQDLKNKVDWCQNRIEYLKKSISNYGKEDLDYQIGNRLINDKIADMEKYKKQINYLMEDK